MEFPITRDRAKVELFNDLNKNSYYLIVVDYSIPIKDRADFILTEFLRQTGFNLKRDPYQQNILDWF